MQTSLHACAGAKSQTFLNMSANEKKSRSNFYQKYFIPFLFKIIKLF